MHALDPSAVHAAEVLHGHLAGKQIDWAVVAGSGLGVALVGALELAIEGEVQLADLGLPAPVAPGHGNRLVWGTLGERRVCVLTGRLHPYEGHPVGVCTAALAAALANGARGVVLTFAACGLDPGLSTGELVILRDQIALLGPSPLVGPQFVDCSEIYSPYLRLRLQALHPGLGPSALREVVYIHARGPQFETPSECEALRRLGGEVVGASTTYEAIFCAAHRVAVAGFGVVTNSAGASGLDHAEVQQRGEDAVVAMAGILRGLLAGSPEPDLSSRSD